MGNWSRPFGQESCRAKAKSKAEADWLHKSEISKPDFNHVYVFTLFSCRLLAELTKKGRPCKKLATLPLFVETMPIYKAVATGNGNNKFYRETTRSNCK